VCFFAGDLLPLLPLNCCFTAFLQALHFGMPESQVFQTSGMIVRQHSSSKAAAVKQQ
jgi:hypothetical protein